MTQNPDPKLAAKRLPTWSHFPLIVLGGLLLLFLVLLQAWRAIDEDIFHTEDIAYRRLANASLVDALARYDYRAATELRDAALAHDPEQRKRYQALAMLHIAQANEAFLALGKSIERPAVRTAYENLTTVRQHLSVQRERFVREIIGDAHFHPAPDAMADLLETLHAARESYQTELESLRKLQDETVLAGAAIAVEAARKTQVLMIIAWVLSGIVLIATGIFWRRHVSQQVAAKDREIRLLEENRTVLVREVHHRIKNHLQGLMGLIQDQQRLKTHRSDELDTLLGHVMSLVAVHGMQSRSISEQVPLAELVTQQVALFRQSQIAQDVVIETKIDDTSFSTPAESAVPLALVISELLLNACKHRDRKATEPIQLHQWQDQHGAHVRIGNPVAHPVMLDMNREQGLGTGLSLVKSMLIDLGEVRTGYHEGCFAVYVLIPPVR